MDNSSVTVHVAGRDYLLNSNDKPEHVKRAAAYADRKIKEVAATGITARETAAIVAALILSDELIKSQDDNTRLRHELLNARPPDE
jgi:cell division protein ZapA (FtsZ GTPase activity inhibitor)